MSARARNDMSRAVLRCLRFGRPDALRNVVRDMPSAWAFLVIIRANSTSVPPSASATTTAISLADLTTSALIASSTSIVEPAGRPSFDGGWPAARFETLSLEVRLSRPSSIASKSR